MGYTLHPKIVTLNSKQKPLEYVEKCGEGFADVPYGLESFKPIYKPRSEKKYAPWNPALTQQRIINMFKCCHSSHFPCPSARTMALLPLPRAPSNKIFWPRAISASIWVWLPCAGMTVPVGMIKVQFRCLTSTSLWKTVKNPWYP